MKGIAAWHAPAIAERSDADASSTSAGFLMSGEMPAPGPERTVAFTECISECLSNASQLPGIGDIASRRLYVLRILEIKLYILPGQNAPNFSRLAKKIVFPDTSTILESLSGACSDDLKIRRREANMSQTVRSGGGTDPFMVLPT